MADATRPGVERRDMMYYEAVAIAYAILRHNGVDIGKMDFLGPVNWIDA
jgi:hypothetical protein